MSTLGTSPNSPAPSLQPRTEIVETRGLGPSNQAHPTHRLDEAPNSRTITSQHSPRITAAQITPPQVVQPSLRNRFADRHPKIISALVKVASNAALISAWVVLTPTFLLTTPVRLAVHALGVISPTKGLSVLQNKYIRFMVGSSTSSIVEDSIGQTDSAFKKRTTFGRELALDVLTLGISMSGINALETGQDLKNQVTNRLASNATLTAMLRERQRQEDERMMEQLEQTPPISRTIQKIFNRLGPDATPTTGIDPAIWYKYNTKQSASGNNSKAFSALLQKVSTGFTNLNVNAPQTRLTKLQEKQYAALVNERIKPVLLIMQSNEEIASQLFTWAELGLGSCADRASSAWQTLELYAHSLSKAHQTIEELTNNNNHMPPQVKEAIQAFVKIELQRFRLGEVKRLTDHFIRDANRGDWQKNSLSASYATLDHVEEILKIIDSLQKTHPEWYNPVPYRRFSSKFTLEDLNRLQGLITEKIKNIDLAKFQEHLKTTDAWQRIVSTVLRTQPKETVNSAIIDQFTQQFLETLVQQ